MRWEMEVEEIEAVLEKIWDLHDKLSDAIHSISRAHFLNSIKSLNAKSSDEFFVHRNTSGRKKVSCDSDDNQRSGFVFVKDLPVDDDDSAIREAKSLNAIRTALENLEDQLEVFHTLQAQQRVERDAAIARLEQSRIVLAMRLAEHQGTKYKVIEEAVAFVKDVRDSGHYVSPDNLYTPGQNSSPQQAKKTNNLIKILLSSLGFFKKSLKMDNVGGIIGNAALVAVSMLAFLHMNQESFRDKHVLNRQEDGFFDRNKMKISRISGSSSNDRSTQQLDVLSARG